MSFNNANHEDLQLVLSNIIDKYQYETNTTIQLKCEIYHNDRHFLKRYCYNNFNDRQIHIQINLSHYEMEGCVMIHTCMNSGEKTPFFNITCEDLELLNGHHSSLMKTINSIFENYNNNKYNRIELSSDSNKVLLVPNYYCGKARKDNYEFVIGVFKYL